MLWLEERIVIAGEKGIVPVPVSLFLEHLVIFSDHRIMKYSLLIGSATYQVAFIEFREFSHATI